MKRFLTFVLATMLLGQYSCRKNSTVEKPMQPGPPVVTTLPVRGISNNIAASGFSVTNQDTTTITERGIVWSTSASPTVGQATKSSIQEDSSTYTLNMPDLDCSKQYFVRAYVITASGDTIYGNELNFVISQIANYENSLVLSTTAAIDTTIKTLYVGKLFPSAGASFLNRLSFPPGVYLYVRFDSAVNLRGDNGVTTRICNTGDTMHFGPISPSGFASESAIVVSPLIDVFDPYKATGGNISIHVAGTAVTTDSSYRCRYYDAGYGMTNTTYQSIFFADTSACQASCEFR